ncbi:MAG: hypothetical protein FWF08_02405 [Oscillospiraceae bacterium]|nr:hypothetical protein [Oscillospiraceae bacterium]
MSKPYKLKPHLCRFLKLYGLSAPEIPKALFEAEQKAPDLTNFPLPLPSLKKDYACFAEGAGGVMWYGAKTGLTRWDPNAERDADRVMYFSADRDLADNNVQALLADGGNVWALTDTAAAYIEMKKLTAEEKADVLLRESLKYVSRRGMMCHKGLTVPRDLDSILPYGSSDNDGCYTSGFAMAEMFRYATFKREKGESHPDTIGARAVATRACEVCLLLMYIAGRGDGFVARSYHTPDEPVPDGAFFRKSGGKAACIDSPYARKMKLAGAEADASAEVPERLAKLYRDLGYSDEGIVYKADTSSDEITLHFLQLNFAYDILVPGDGELGALIKNAATATMGHIIEHNFTLCDATGKPTTWSRWDGEYFASPTGWADGPLNSAEILMYLKVTMKITGEKGIWQEAYDFLMEKGYAELTLKHFDRFYHVNCLLGFDIRDDLMFGDHALATSAFWGLIINEADEEYKRIYREGFKAWRTSIEREHNPGYDFPYILSCPDEKIDMERIADWFYRSNPSRLIAGVKIEGRHDIAVRELRGGGKNTSYLLPPDERFITKNNRDALVYREIPPGSMMSVDSCYVYTFAYWMGRYFELIA